MSIELPACVESATEHRLFAYGTLVDPRCLDDVLGHRHTGERLRARLTGYQRVASEGYPYPFIVATHGGVVDGVLVLDLTPYDLAVLDRYEEIGEGVYRRELVEVEAWGCGPSTWHMQAFTYVAGAVLAPLASVSTAR
jgi:gamma-glutamylcyclotransferase (GGCT)/AIG2-like uncharacterized protein YtfP